MKQDKNECLLLLHGNKTLLILLFSFSHMHFQTLHAD